MGQFKKSPLATIGQAICSTLFTVNRTTMSPNGSITFSYKINEPPYKLNEDLVHKKEVIVRTDLIDLNVHQYYTLFKDFLKGIGFSEYVIADGAAGALFDEFTPDETLKKLSDKYDFVLEQPEQHYLTKNEITAAKVYLETGDFESKLFDFRTIQVLDEARNIIKDLQDKVKEQEEVIEEWVTKYDQQFSIKK